jgi:tetratricopeptide (TPR) repeat protein
VPGKPSVSPNTLEDSRNLEALGDSLKSMGRLSEALTCYEKSLADRRDSPELLFKIGNMLVGLDHPQWAAPYYKKSLALAPNWPEALYNLGTSLGLSGDYEAAAAYYRQCLDLRPDFPEALHGLATALMALGRHPEAVELLRRALELKPDFAQAAKDLKSAYRIMAPRWHFAMLADQPRNLAYQRALERAIRPGQRVLDIGTGSGLLAMMAARAGAAEVYTCESHPLLARKARQIIEQNGLSRRIKVINKRSQALRVGVDLPGPADLLAAEIFDAGLLGEKALAVIKHARQHLLAPGARIIPREARVYARLAESKKLRLLDRVPDQVCGFDLSALNEFSEALYFSHDVAQAEHRWLSDRFTVFNYDFEGELKINDKALLKIPAAETGVCHAVVFWFRLFLDDEECLDTGPGRRTHWTQAVQVLNQPLELEKGRKVILWVEQDSRGIHFEPRAVLPLSITALNTEPATGEPSGQGETPMALPAA